MKVKGITILSPETAHNYFLHICVHIKGTALSILPEKKSRKLYLTITLSFIPARKLKRNTALWDTGGAYL